MLILDKYVIMPGGSVMNYETGEIKFVTKNQTGQKGMVLTDSEGKSHYYLERYLINLKRKFDKEDVDKGL